MELDQLIKYIIWAFFFMVAVTGVYFLLNKMGVI